MSVIDVRTRHVVQTISFGECMGAPTVAAPGQEKAGLMVRLQVQQERDMLHSSRRAGTPGRGDAVQPFMSHPGNGPDGGNVVCMHPQRSSLQMMLIYYSAGRLPARPLQWEHAVDTAICVGHDHSQETGIPWP